MSKTPTRIACQIVRDMPGELSIAITDGTQEFYGLAPRDKWFFIPRSEIVDCDPPLDRLPKGEAPMVTLTIPEWLAIDRGLV